MSHRTIINYDGGTPTVTGTVTLFNSVTAFPPGGSFHLLGQMWFQFTLAIGSSGGTGTGTITGAFSDDKGVTWRTFYTGTNADGTTASPTVTEDEVYVGMFKDIRFQYTNAVEVPTVFQAALALNSDKASSKVATTAVLVNNGALTGRYRSPPPRARACSTASRPSWSRAPGRRRSRSIRPIPRSASSTSARRVRARPSARRTWIAWR